MILGVGRSLEAVLAHPMGLHKQDRQLWHQACYADSPEARAIEIVADSALSCMTAAHCWVGPRVGSDESLRLAAVQIWSCKQHLCQLTPLHLSAAPGQHALAACWLLMAAQQAHLQGGEGAA